MERVIEANAVVVSGIYRLVTTSAAEVKGRDTSLRPVSGYVSAGVEDHRSFRHTPEHVERL